MCLCVFVYTVYVCVQFTEPASQYVPYPLPDTHGRPLSNKVQAADRKQVNGVGANWYLIAVVGCSISELDCRHTVHEMNCAWEAQGAEVFFILFSSFDVSHQTSVSLRYFSLALSKGRKEKRCGPLHDSDLQTFSIIQRIFPSVGLSLPNKQLEDQD